jgi:hypothetical protein
MSNDLLSQIIPIGVDHQEALEVIVAHFGGARCSSECDVEVPANGPIALRIRTKGKHIIRIDAGPGLEADHISELRASIHSVLVESQEQFIAAQVLFSSQPVRGSYRSHNPDVQIIEAPSAAPRSSLQIADHPFVLEFRCSRTADPLISANRRSQLVRQWTDILNIVLISRLVVLEGQSHWSWVKTESDRATGVRFAQHHYRVPGFTAVRADFSEPAGQITAVAQNEYYSQPQAMYGADFTIPDNLAQTLNRIYNLSDALRSRFFQSARWLSIAYDPWQTHASCRYIATVAAIESLMPTVSGGPKCTECGRDIGPGPTERFRQFLDQHVPSTNDMRKIARSLYEVRSGLAHGKYLLVSDAGAITRFDTPWLRECQSSMELHRVSRLAAMNWLYAQDVA